jgi:hypothetical protein
VPCRDNVVKTSECGQTTFEITLDYIRDSPRAHTFRVAFHSANRRCLLVYPEVTGVTFYKSNNIVAEWETQTLGSTPLDDFVLNPGARIAFDLYANINVKISELEWTINLPAGQFDVQFVYKVDRNTDWYDYLAKRSRFAAVTPVWRGVVTSNRIPFTVVDRE